MEKPYNTANLYMHQSLQKWQDGECIHSWKLSFSARLMYLCDMIANLVILPFAIIGVIFGSLHGLFTWNASVFKPTKDFIMETSNHFLLSLCGSLISPTLAYKYRDANPAVYLLVLRVAVISGGLIYYGFFR